MTRTVHVPEPEVLPAQRVVAEPGALDSANWPSTAVVMRLAPDEVLVVAGSVPPLDDPHALIEPEEGFVGVDSTRADIRAWMSREAEWEIPTSGQCFAQGMVAGLPVKIWVDGDRALVLTRASLRHDLAERL